AVLGHLVLQHPLEANAVVQEEITLRFVGEVSAENELTAAGGTHTFDDELLHRFMLARIVHMPRERRTEVIGAPRRVGHKVLAPPVVNVAPRVGKGIRNKNFQLLPTRFIPKHRSIFDAYWTVGR